jgi:nucleoside-diphosphate-sugar epimerase
LSIAALAQSVERRSRKAKVSGSIPEGGSTSESQDKPPRQYGHKSPQGVQGIQLELRPSRRKMAFESKLVGDYKLPSLEHTFSPEDRILILGAGGWFGQTMLNMLGPSTPTLAISSAPGKGQSRWDINEVENFRPTFVANFAFLTRNRQSQYRRETYISMNLELIERMKYAAQLKTVKGLITVSSGASQDSEARDGLESREIYGALKRLEEMTALACQNSARSAVILRAYSVSGPYVRNPQQYAFSSFVEQGVQEKEIKISSTYPVLRRYVSVGDLLAVGLRQAKSGFSGVIESGGELIELQELAHLVGEYLKVPVIERKSLDLSQCDNYYSDNSSWEQNLKETGLQPLTLRQQVEVTANFLQRSGTKVH